MSTLKKDRILITYIESGMGHIMSAQAIEKSLLKRTDRDFEIIHSDIMKEDKDEDLINFEQFLTNQVKMTNKHKAYGFMFFNMFEYVGKDKFMRLVHTTLFKNATNKTIEAMRKHNPDVVISTHYFITFCAIELKKRYMPDLLVITYNPDNNVHVWWDSRSEVFITNNVSAKNEAIERNFNPCSIREVYFTAREEVVNANGTKSEYRAKYGFDQNRFTVAVADGAYATAKVRSVGKQMLKTKEDITLIILAGKNEKVYEYFMNMKAKVKPNIKLEVFKFTPQAYELYAAADLFVTKAGPNAILDSLFMGTPILVDFYAHPIEKATCNLFVKKLKCGTKVFKAKKVREEVELLMKDKDRYDFYKRNVSKIDKHLSGADQITDIIFQELDKKHLEEKNERI